MRLNNRLCVSIELSSRLVSKQVLSPLQSLTSVFGMGTGGPFAFETLTLKQDLSASFHHDENPNKRKLQKNETQVNHLNKSSSPRSISISQLNTLLCLHP